MTPEHSARHEVAPRLVLRPVRLDEADARLLLGWRNDPETRSASFDMAERDWSEFWPRFRDSYVRPNLPPPVIVEADGVPAASIRFDEPRLERYAAPGAVEISIHVAPELRRRGIGVRALALCRAYVARFGGRKLIALVKSENGPSHAVFRRAGYRRMSAENIAIPNAPAPVAVIVYEQDV